MSVVSYCTLKDSTLSCFHFFIQEEEIQKRKIDLQDQVHQAKRRTLGNIQFIGELFKRKVNICKTVPRSTACLIETYWRPCQLPIFRCWQRALCMTVLWSYCGEMMRNHLSVCASFLLPLAKIWTVKRARWLYWEHYSYRTSW